MKYRLISGVEMPYSSTRILGIEGVDDVIDVSLLKFKNDNEISLPKADFLISGLHPVLICRLETLLLFGEIFVSGFRRYKCTVDGAVHIMLACQIEHECFDYKRSMFDRYELPPPRKRISTIKKLNVRKDFCTSDPIFRIADEWSCKYELIVGEKFMNIYYDNKLSGLVFTESK